MCAILCNEPFWLRPNEISQLTPWQVRHLYLCDRDHNGKVIVDEPEIVCQDPKFYFFRHWKSEGLRDDLIEKLWAEKSGVDDGRE